MNLKFELTLDESNVILGALGDQPYVKVAELVMKIRNQAMAQINAANEQPQTAEQGAADQVRAVTQAVANS
jgi:hypothetical protein